MKFWLKSSKQAAKKNYELMCLIIYFNSHHHDMTLNERYIGQSISFIRGVTYALCLENLCSSSVYEARRLI